MPSGWLELLKKLIILQGRYAWAEKEIKVIRGWAVHLAGHIQAGKSQAGQTHLHEVQRLLEWMRALDDGGQVERLAEWQTYFETLSPEKAGAVITRCLSLRFAQK